MRYLLLLAFVFTLTLAEDLLKDFAAGNIKFAADIYKQLPKNRSEDFFVCILTLQNALALAYTGAKGQTAQQLSSVLHLPESLEKAEEIFTKLTSTFKDNENYTLRSANKLYIKDGFKIKNSFKRNAITVFGTETENIDFSKSIYAASEINKWVEKKTNGYYIRNVVKAKDVKASTMAIFISFIHFYGGWAQSFPASATHVRAFHINSKKQREIDMMEVIGEFNYYESSKLKAKFLELPYRGKAGTMTIVLPNKIEGLRALEGRIADALTAPLYKRKRVKVVLPRFETITKIEFKPILQALGVTDAFGDKADFSGITDSHVKISKVKQWVRFTVDEARTSAASESMAVGMRTRRSDLPRPKKFIADRPFLLYVKNNSSIIFVGRYVSGIPLHDGKTER